jgi:hypothetical protein
MPRSKTKWKPISFDKLEKYTGLRLRYSLAGGGGATRGAFPTENERSRNMALAVAGALDGMGVRIEGAVGCLDRASAMVIAVSGKILKELDDRTQELVDFVYNGNPLTLKATIDPVIQDAVERAPENTPACAERYLYSLRDNTLPIVGMTVVWYRGTSGRWAPTRYKALSSSRFETMAPCSICVTNSTLMMNVARDND